MCQPMPIGFYTRWDLDSETGRFTPRQNKTSCFEKIVRSQFQRTRPDCIMEISLQQAHRKLLTASVFLENNDIELHITKGNSHYSSSFVLPRTRTRLYKNTPFR